MRRDPSVGRLLTRAFGALVLLIVCSGLAETAAMLVQRRVVRQLTTHVQPLELANTHLRVVLADAQRGLRGYLLTADSQLLDTYLVAHSEYPVAVQDVRDLVTRGESGPVNREVSRADAWWALAEQQRLVTPRSDAAVRYTALGRPLFEDFLSANNDFGLALATRTASLQRESAQLGVLTLASVVALTVAAALVAALTARRMTRLITRPLGVVVDVLARRRAGEREARADSLAGPVEIREVAEAVNTTADENDRIRAAEHDLARLSSEREQALVTRLRQLETAKTDFMSTVSHELRTPLTSIAGYVELLLDAEAGEPNPAQQRMLEVIGRNTRRLRELIEDMLILSKIESGAFRTAKQAVDVAVLVENALAAIAPAAAKASVGLHTEVYGPLPLAADPGQIDRVLSNLLANAVKFTRPEGTVTVIARRDGDAVVIAVADTGMGIPEAEQQALFARFFRASNAIHQAIPGTGLGLAIARTIVDNHGGRIDVESTERVGTTVTVRLPADA
jgi:signal transduction histidine kinase